MRTNYCNKVKTGWSLALQLRESKDYNNSASRMYYSVFQAVLFYAVQKERFDREKARREQRNVHKLMKHVATEKMKHVRDSYEDLRELRNKADYDPEDVQQFELNASFVHSVETIKDFFLKEAMK